jgi:RNA polymerase sigma-70 factor (ECF subfamily)
VLGSEDAEDAAQEAVLRAWRHAQSCLRDDPSPWVARIAHREALRMASRHREEPLEGTDEACLAGRAIPLQPHEDRLDLRSALLNLSQSEQEALLLHYWADMTHEEIAQAVGAPLGTVKIRVFRARMKLRPALAREE